MSLYWFPFMKQVVVANWTIVDVTIPGDAFTYDHVPSTYDTFNLAVLPTVEKLQALAASPTPIISNAAYESLHLLEVVVQETLVGFVPDFVPIYSEDGITVLNPAVGYYDRMFCPTCSDDDSSPLQCIWAHGRVHANITILDNEISVALEDMPNFIRDVKNILRISPAAFILQGILMRFSGSSDDYMSTNYGRDTVHFEFYLFNRINHFKDAVAGLASFQTIMQTLAKKYNGRSHWGKSGLVYQSESMITMKLEPFARSGFIASMEKFDPNGVFMNHFGERIKGTGSIIDTDPAVTHCALLDNCFCSVDTDCAAYQKCTHIQGYNYPVCKTIIGLDEVLSAQPCVSSSHFHLNITISTQGFVYWLRNVVPNLIDEIFKSKNVYCNN